MGSDRHDGPRRQARELALQWLYEQDLAGAGVDEILAHWDQSASSVYRQEDDGADGDSQPRVSGPPPTGRALAYARELFMGAHARRAAIDERIAAQAENWRLERMAMVDRNILRLAVYELEHQRDIPAAVILDEAIELAKRFGAEDSSKFVNGILDAMVKNRRRSGPVQNTGE